MNNEADKNWGGWSDGNEKTRDRTGWKWQYWNKSWGNSWSGQDTKSIGKVVKGDSWSHGGKRLPRYAEAAIRAAAAAARAKATKDNTRCGQAESTRGDGGSGSDEIGGSAQKCWDEWNKRPVETNRIMASGTIWRRSREAAWNNDIGYETECCDGYRNNWGGGANGKEGSGESRSEVWNDCVRSGKNSWDLYNKLRGLKGRSDG